MKTLLHSLLIVAITSAAFSAYPYPPERNTDPCRYCDLSSDSRIGEVDLVDFAEVTRWWMDTCDGSQYYQWCNGSDINFDGQVNISDLLYLSDCWMVRDDIIPEPNQSQWGIRSVEVLNPDYVEGQSLPLTIIVEYDGKPAPVKNTRNKIIMTAAPTVDNWGWKIAYQFECIEGRDSSGRLGISDWLYFPSDVDPTWIHSGLIQGRTYWYVVRAAEIRVPGELDDYYFIEANGPTVIYPDDIGLITSDSTAAAAIPGLDVTPPGPISWATTALGDNFEGFPVGINDTSITMTAHAAQDSSPPVKYMFIRYLDVAGTIQDPAFQTELEFDEIIQTNLPKYRWRESTTFTDTGLPPDLSVVYTYRFQARDSVGNISTLSNPASASVIIPDTQAPMPDPSEWEEPPHLTYFLGSWWAAMSAVRATDNETPDNQIEYFFDSSDNTLDSGWLSDMDTPYRPNPLDPTGTTFMNGNVYIINLGLKNHSTWTVRTRDKASPEPNISLDSVEIDTGSATP